MAIGGSEYSNRGRISLVVFRHTHDTTQLAVDILVAKTVAVDYDIQHEEL